MEWLNIILGALVALLAGLNIFQLFSFKAYKKKYKAEAEKDEAEAAESKQSALERRITAIEELYARQSVTVDELRKEILRLTEEKFKNEKRIIQLESENKMLREKVDSFEKDLETYKRSKGNS